MKFQYIISNPEILNGKPIVKGTRISVELILEWLASGALPEEIEKKYSRVKKAAVLEALRYAARFTRNEIVLEVKIAA